MRPLLKSPGRLLGSLRGQLALLGFLAIYAPALLLFGVILATDTETTREDTTGAPAVESTTTHGSAPVIGTVVALGPLAPGLARWWAGRAVPPKHT
ncbi:hypothetical protein, partial [Streptomyces lasiicapitis]|uniref:hypothetical protein n=1 Tax=Streptomyces lasiicapitis TaxID=1923961 RepID=UPI003677BE58